MKYQNNGLTEFHDLNNKKEQGFFCIKLVEFLNQEAELGTQEYGNLWRERFGMAKAGKCYYIQDCPIYERTNKRLAQSVAYQKSKR